ncbi:MAG: putative glycoside hydrolase [Actinomycetota bacterium]|nr:putative glycoside hydrolase [Actinomycetota bacterium]
MKRQTQLRLLVALTIVWVAWAGWSLLGRATPYELRVLNDVGDPVVSAVVDVDGNQMGTSGEDGRVQMDWNRSSTVLEVSAPGHVAHTLTLAERPEGLVDVVLKARVLRGLVVDVEGVPVEGAVIQAGPSSGVSDAEGRFSLRGAEPGIVTVERPAWLTTTFTWDGGVGEALAEMTQFTARAVHISGEAVSERFEEFLRMADTTELNAVMIDLKDEEGIIWYKTTNQTSIAAGSNHGAYDLKAVVERAHARGLYAIGRLVLFNDPKVAQAVPSMAIWDTTTDAPFSSRGQYFLDPTDPDARAFGIELAAEACAAGLDEIQFDYVRFPDVPVETRATMRFDEELTDEVRLSTIPAFLSEAVNVLHPMGCAVAADVFGFLTTDTSDGYIGQTWEDIANIVDVVSPMVYPSHYGPGWFQKENPNDHPADVVDEALSDGMDRLPRSVVVRPWLQDFGYDESQVRAQITSAERYDLGWMLWNAKSNVTVSALGPS